MGSTMYHAFNTDEAGKYGIEEAIIVEHFRFWIIKNRADGTHYHDGRYWTFASVEALTIVFPYLSHKQIRRAIAHLETLKVIQTGNYNKAGYDRTKWYSFTDEVGLLPPVNWPKRAKVTAQTGQPIPYSPTDTPTDKDSANALKGKNWIPIGFDTPDSDGLE